MKERKILCVTIEKEINDEELQDDALYNLIEETLGLNGFTDCILSQVVK